jgi:hypothetical protein
VVQRRTTCVSTSCAQVAKHYGVSVAICPPRHGNRKAWSRGLARGTVTVTGRLGEPTSDIAAPTGM